jgi:hypothetical protein
MTEVRLRLLVPSPSGDRVLLDDRFDLPAVDVHVEQTAISGSASALRTLGLTPPVLDCFVDQRPDDELAREPRQALIVLPAPGAPYRPSSGLRWVPIHAARPRLPAPLERICADRLAEIAGERAAHPLRTAWAEPGWYERATAWIERSLADAGRAAPDEVVQYRHWGISAIMYAEARDGRSWFKASFPPFAHEPAVTRLVGAAAPGLTPDVIATDRDAGWMLLDDIGPTTVDAVADASAAIDRLVAAQADMVDRVDDFLAVGCTDRRLERLSSSLVSALDGPTVAAAGVELTAQRRRALGAAVDRAAEAVLDAGLPTTVAHGDFHPGNVAVVPDRGIVIFDWSDACITTPVIDLAVWAWWCDEREAPQRQLWDQFGAAWERHWEVDASCLDRRSVDVVAAAFHTISYVGIVEHLEPCRWPESVEGVRRFAMMLDRLAG